MGFPANFLFVQRESSLTSRTNFLVYTTEPDLAESCLGKFFSFMDLARVCYRT